MKGCRREATSARSDIEEVVLGYTDRSAPVGHTIGQLPAVGSGFAVEHKRCSVVAADVGLLLFGFQALAALPQLHMLVSARGRQEPGHRSLWHRQDRRSVRGFEGRQRQRVDSARATPLCVVAVVPMLLMVRVLVLSCRG